jgi:serine/threonine-protein kinase
MRGRYHLGLNPACVLVALDSRTGVPRIQLWDFGLVANADQVATDWYAEFVPPAYLAPELCLSPGRARSASIRTDAYGLGVVLYEMLAGEPVVPYRLKTDAEVVDAVMRNARIRMNRVEDVASIAEIALRATSPDSEKRPLTAAEIVEQLAGFVGDVPPAKTRSWPTRVAIMLVLALLALISLASIALLLTAQP